MTTYSYYYIFTKDHECIGEFMFSDGLLCGRPEGFDELGWYGTKDDVFVWCKEHDLYLLRRRNHWYET